MSEELESKDWNDLRYPDRWERLTESERHDIRVRVTTLLVDLRAQAVALQERVKELEEFKKTANTPNLCDVVVSQANRGLELIEKNERLTAENERLRKRERDTADALLIMAGKYTKSRKEWDRMLSANSDYHKNMESLLAARDARIAVLLGLMREHQHDGSGDCGSEKEQEKWCPICQFFAAESAPPKPAKGQAVKSNERWAGSVERPCGCKEPGRSECAKQSGQAWDMFCQCDCHACPPAPRQGGD